MSRAKVSVVVPTYNQALHIGECLRSVVSQTYADWEVVVVDDGSTDGTRSEVAKLDDDRIKYFHQVHYGVSEARNVGVSRSSGNYIAFLDSDDMFHPRRLERQVAAMEKDPKACLCFASRVEIHRDGHPLGLHRGPAEINFETLVVDFPFAPSDIMVRRAWFEKIGGFDPSVVVNEDRDFYLGLALAGGRFRRLDEFLGYHRYYPGRVFADLRKRLSDKLRVLDKFFEKVDQMDDVFRVRNAAYFNTYKYSAYLAFIAGERALADSWFEDAAAWDQSADERKARRLMFFLIELCLIHQEDHDAFLRRILPRLPGSLRCSTETVNNAVAQVYLRKGVREVMWNRMETGRSSFEKAAQLSAQVDHGFLLRLTGELTDYEVGFGSEAKALLLQRLVPLLKVVDERAFENWLQHPNP
jgi:glycosyltransferase involved in cell wall biosynthesis